MSDGGIETVAGGSLDAQCACEAWSCTIGDCGYDPATDARGACCVENVCGGTPVSKPSCELNPQYCSQTAGSGEYGVDFCVGVPVSQCNNCPGQFVCCYGGDFGDPWGTF